MSKPNADEEMRKLRLKRGQHKATITRIDNFVRDPVSFAAASVDILEARKEALVNALKAYETVQLDILSMDERDIEEVGIVEDKYFSVLAKINASLKSLSTKKVSECQNVSSCKLPTIEIPIFDGKDFTKFRPFYDLFMAIIDQNSVLSHVQKLFYLRKYLADDALAVIVNLPLVNESYKQALDLLSKRFDNKARLVSNHIGILLDLPILQNGTATSIRSFVSHIKQQLHALQNLNEPIDKWDMILISIFTRKLDPVTNRAYQLDRDSEHMPSMADFLDFLEKRAIALEDSSIPQKGACYEGAPNTSKVYKSLPPKVTNVVTKNVKTCKFCNKPNHAIFSCPVFQTAALKDRLLFVRDHELCQTCLKPHSEPISSRARPYNYGNMCPVTDPCSSFCCYPSVAATRTPVNVCFIYPECPKPEPDPPKPDPPKPDSPKPDPPKPGLPKPDPPKPDPPNQEANDQPSRRTGSDFATGMLSMPALFADVMLNRRFSMKI